MGKNVIVSEETLRDLLEAHASLSAWYYVLWNALRRAGGTANAPDGSERAAFLERIAQEYPELAAMARSLGEPRMFVPAPPSVAPPPLVGSAGGNEPTTAVEPATARARERQGGGSEPEGEGGRS
ncbi:hypothetical protein [Chondromyces crocatus]|uniref:Uncharacterized protein n=1 Tax=Chondromyces crocatus TaxID=52 RepID=A0A0K1ERF1_CHOCO|nr:hypothetical protein [Chondromyces crocatus]AKT43421.1 uncharacterized protein CMC5_076530 [Chondromyces crocatus]